MKAKAQQFLENNPNPVLSIEKDGTVFYSNRAGELLLYAWGVRVGERLPLDLADFAKRVISSKIPEKTEVKTEQGVYLIIFHPPLQDEYLNIYGFDISDQKKLEEKLRIKEKQNDVLHKIGKMALGQESLQKFMDESVKLIASILDLEYCKIMELLPDGNFLLRAGTGWKSVFVGKHFVGEENESQAGYTLISRMPLIVEDFETENRFNIPEILKIHGMASGASVVIGSTENAFGVLVVNSTKKRKFTSDDTYFLTSVAFLIAQVIERKKAEEALKQANDSLEVKVKARTAELEAAYQSLKESEESLAEAQKMANLGNWDWNLITGEMYLSDEMFRIFGLTHRKSGSSYKEILSCTHPDDREYVDNAVNRAFKGEPFAIDLRIVLATGEEHSVHARGDVIYDEKNVPVRMIGTVQDITERKRAEEKIQNLADIVESSNDAIITESLDGTITSWNKGSEQIYGYLAEEMIGRDASILEPDNLKGEISRFVGKVKQGENTRNYETLRLKKDGTLINISVNISPICDASGKLTAVSIIARDVTLRKRAEEALANIEIARKKEIHHRIKNNLQVISSLLDLQSEKFRYRKYVENSEVLNAFRESQDRVMSIALIHEELHEGTGNNTLNFSPYLERLVKKLFQTYRVGNASTVLIIELEENVFFDMDIAVPLGIIINELVSNSLKYAFPGKNKGEIKIKLVRDKTVEYSSTECTGIMQKSKKEGFKGTNFILSVSDNGVGMPEGFNLGGHGSLGTQLVNILVDQLGGELELKKYKGTEFFIKFWANETNYQLKPNK